MAFCQEYGYFIDTMNNILKWESDGILKWKSQQKAKWILVQLGKLQTVEHFNCFLGNILQCISIIHHFLDFVYNEQTYTCSRALSTIVLYALLYMVRKKLDACI